MGNDQHPLGVILCRRGSRSTPPCATCGSTNAPHLCDWKIGDRKGGRKTCDRRMCAQHAYAPPGTKDVHWCPPHRRMHESGQRELGAPGGG